MNNQQPFDLATRTKKFAQNCRIIIKCIPINNANTDDSKQLVRSSGSVAANYLEADEALSKKDFVMRIKITRKEARESMLWLELLEILDPETNSSRNNLVQEAYQLVKIFNSIVTKSV